MSWFYRPSITKSIAELNALVKEVLLAPDFNQEDLTGFDATKQNSLMDNYQEHETHETSSCLPSPFSFDDRWIKGSVEIPLACDGFKHASEAAAPTFKVEFHYRKLTEVIRSALAEPAAEKFHTFPFKAYWNASPDGPEERIYSDVYTGDMWNAEYDKILNAVREGPNAHLEAFIVSLLIWSDATALGQFGNAELWPVYLYLGNQSKYDRAKPNSFASHHIAYLPKVWFLALFVQIIYVA
jgi:hypothetical protein